jgi:hypothetical protein
LDQLDDSNDGRKLGWLPVRGLADSVHLVVSTLPDHLNPDVGAPFCCLSVLQGKLPTECFVQLEPLKSPVLLLKHLLKHQGRSTTEHQTKAVLRAVESAEDRTQTPLMITMLANWAAEWRSFTEAPTVGTSVRAIIVDFFKRLETCHGKQLVLHVIACITIAKQGVTETELQEILSIADDVLAEIFPWCVVPYQSMDSGS